MNVRFLVYLAMLILNESGLSDIKAMHAGDILDNYII